ncbi:MAG: DedA family protein [Prevotella sp.]|jgi:membrane protein DedA with SNARE-associated domain
MDWISSLLSNLNYATIYILMLLESTVIPVPSELVVAPAAYHSAAGHINIWLVVLFATLGADTGATINYMAGYFLGRPIIYRFANSRLGHLCMLNQSKVEKSEKYFDDHGMIATITGRLIPGIRHLISIPAGLAKMNYWKFLLYTTLGAGVWHSVLAILGWYLHYVVPEEQLNDKILEYGEYIKFFICAAVGIAVVYFTIRYLIRRHKAISSGEDKTE